MKDDPENDFFTAIILGDLEMVQEILPAHPDALSWITPAGYPPLHMAIMNHRDDIAVWLVENGADLGQKALGASAATLADSKGLLGRLNDAALRRAQGMASDACGDHMREGLKKPLRMSGKSLALRRRASGP